MRVLFATGSPASYMAPPMLGSEQVVCGPVVRDERAPDGRYVSLATPLGKYDLAAVAAKLPAAQAPDLVVCLVDATWRNMPENLARFRCPRVLLVADTHHLRTPLLGMLQYAMSQPFTRIVLLYDRHHAAFFRAAGLRNVYWFPGLTFPHSDATVRAARSAIRTPQVAFVGSAGSFHPRRQRMAEAMTAAGLPYVPKALAQAEGLSHYGASLLGFNASLNGDLNLRVFEILASGAALLTDRLSAEAGLDLLLRDDRDMLLYRSREELVDRVVSALADPAATTALGMAGMRWFDENFSQARRMALFRALAFDGVAPALFPCPGLEAAQSHLVGGPARLIPTTLFYETLQTVHRDRETVRVALGADVPPQLARLCRTLPRVETLEARPDLPADFLVTSARDAKTLAGEATRLWCWDATKEQIPEVAQQLMEAGYLSAEPNTALFRRVRSDVGDGRRHILVYTDDADLGGVAQYNHAILLALVDAGYRVTCVQSPSDSPLVREQRERGVVHRWLGYDPVKEFKRSITDADRAEDYLCDDRPDLILFSDCCPVSNLAAREVALRFGIPYLIVIGFVAEYLAENFAPCLPQVTRHFAAAREVVAVSHENLHLLRTRFRLAANRGVVIHYGRPPKFFEPRNEAVRARLRAELGLSEDAVVCLTTARLSRLKGYWEQLAAIELLRRTPAFDKLVFVWLGEGDERKALEEAIVKAKLTGKVFLLGHRWDVADWYDAADIFVLPSHAEGMPLSIMEAMAKGLPVIASAVSGIPEELGDTGILLPDSNGTPEWARLAPAVVRLVCQASERASIGKSLAARARDMFQERKMVQATMAVVASLFEHGDVEASACETVPKALGLPHATNGSRIGGFAP